MEKRRVILTTCVYCEASKDEILARHPGLEPDMALRFVLIKENQVLLCPDCRKKHAAWFDEELDELMNGPVTFPPGVTAVEHVCPELEYQGMSAEDATSTLVLERRDGGGDYIYATCPHCEVTVRSLI